MKRRDFISRSALATAGTMLIPNFLKAFEQQQLNVKGLGGKKLVIVQLSGGNDGLNTVIPFRNDIYYKLRPKLAIESPQVLRLTDEQGLNPAMTGLQQLYDEGLLTILNSVGYPNPDRSHFRSMDIWQTASGSDEFLGTGWIGRYLDAACGGTCTQPYNAIEVDDTLSLALKGERLKGLSVQNPQKLYQFTHNPSVTSIHAAHDAADDHAQVSYLYKTLGETISSAAYLYDKSKIYKTQATYPTTELGRKLKTIAELILSGVDTSVFYVSISGFDTHVNQKVQQERLLKQYSEAMYIFVQDLKQKQQLDETVVMTFSEFGRRVAQNGSGGTDHGTANNVFLMGGKLQKPGFFNQSPNLQTLDEGDLTYQIDFRDIYATLLHHWLEVDDAAILGRKMQGLPLV